MRLALPTAVFVPFEFTDGAWLKRDDLPRFIETEEVIRYLQSHPRLSAHTLEWREHSEKDAIDEYVAGMGTARFRRQ